MGGAGRSPFDEITARSAYALIRFRDENVVTLLAGERTDVEHLDDVPLTQGPPEGRRFDRLVAVPYRQVRERGFDAVDDGTPLSVVTIDDERTIGLADAYAQLPTRPPAFADRGGFDTPDTEYEHLVAAVIRDEIGNGEGANLVIGRTWRARAEQFGHAEALAVWRRLLETERGAYWTFCCFTGDRWLIGASPERHVSLDNGQVRMNPISGTLRLRGLDTAAARKQALLEFLDDEKEIYELFMVVDEELKVMCDICSEGGLVLGPYLKPMTHLVHTEYLLAGRTHRDPRRVLRDSLLAATVTGSPVENACRLIATYEPKGRGYYGSVLALLGRDDAGHPTLDAPILIRTADVALDGQAAVTAGATLVRDSDPAYETEETHAKAGGVLTAFGLVDPPTPVTGEVGDLAADEDVRIALGSRNQRLAPFWLTDQSGTPPQSELTGGYDLVVVGPGPGDPRALNDAKMAGLRRTVDELLAAGRPFLAVCLGHQLLAGALGFDLAYKDIVFQGTQSRLPVLGRDELVGFYNTFVARVPESGVPSGVRVETDAATGDVHLLAGPHYRGVQFHAESILSLRGFEIVRDLVTELLG
ncbi:MAG: chorismate-binding protein [Actinomycetota bacterium]|nr:chorismate-binding protein [Actinomycetota bacterium]